MPIAYDQINRFLRPAGQFLLGVAGVALLTFICFQLQFSLATAAFVYLIAIVLSSLRGSFIWSAVLSIITVGCMVYFFAMPIFDLRIDDPLDFVVVIAFLLTAFIVTTLVRRAGNQAEAALQAQARAHQAERELRLAIDTIPALVWTTRPNGSLDYINQRWAEVGLSLPDLQGSQWMAVIHPAESAGVMDRWNTAVATGQPYENVERVRQADGEYRWYLSRATPLRDESGKIIKWYGVDADIEDQRRAEDALRRSEDRLRLVIDTIPALVWSALPDGSVDYINRRWQETTDFPIEDALGRGWQAVVHPQDLAGFMDDWREALASGAPFEHEARVRGADGEYRWLLIRTVPLRDELGNIVKWYGTSVDIEDRKRAEDALRESEQRFRDYAETASDWFWQTGPDHRFTRVSEHLDPVGAAPPSRIGMARCDVATDVESEPEKWRLHQATLDAHRPFRDFVYGFARADGSVSYIQTSGKPLFDLKGNFLGYRGVSTDVTAAVRADQAEEALHKVQAELAHVTRLTTLGELTASITHEVNQPLAGIVANGGACLRWLERDVPQLEEVRSAVNLMINDGKRASEVVRRVRSLTKKTEPLKAPLPIKEVIDEVILLLQHELLSHQALLRREVASELPPVLADRIQLQQVIINLMMNGMEAMAQVAGRPRELKVLARLEADQLLVAVQDSGVGIDPEQIDPLFNAFFTTKPDGMGMGLSICRSIINAHGGKLWASRNAGAGATFQFTLPTYRD